MSIKSVNGNKTQLRAEGTPPEPMPKGKKAKKAEDEMESEGDETMESDDEKDEKVADDDSEAKADEEMESEDEKKDAEEKVASEEEDDEDEKKKKAPAGKKAALKALARKHGLDASASESEILSAAAASPNIEALVERRVKAQLDASEKKRAKAEAVKRAENLASAAVRGGYEEQDKSFLVEFATSNFKAAERSVAHFIKNEEKLYGRVTQSGSDRPATSGDTQTRQFGSVKVMKHGLSLSAEAKKLAAKENISFEAALERVEREKPELVKAYMGGF